MATHPHLRLHTFRRLVAATAIVLVWSVPTRGLPPVREREIERHPGIELQQRAQKELRDNLREAHPDWTDSEIKAEIERVMGGLGPERKPAVTPGLGASLRIEPPPATIAVKQLGAQLLKPDEARGWGY